MTGEEWSKIILVISAFLAWAIVGGMAVRKQEQYRGGPFCLYPTPMYVDYPMCEFKIRTASIVNNEMRPMRGQIAMR